ncbi:transcription factor S-II, central domain-containing protein [Peziza echinospora]|nr:transcription factor S-II, central domain-containing protein [Peziza echinospora]
MNAAEIKTRITDLENATKQNLPAEAIVDILTSLQKEVKITEKLLRETKVGIAVNRLRSHTNKTVSDLSRDIVLRWKSEVKPAAKPKDSASASRNVTSPKHSTKSPSIPPPDARSRSISSQGGGKTAEGGPRTKESDKINWKVMGDSVRDNCLGMIYDGLCFESDADSKKILDRARSVEKAVYALANKTDNTYKFKIRSLYLNLKDPKNPNLRRSVLNGDISPEALSTMTTQEMASSEKKLEIERIQRENMDNAMAPQAVKSTTDQFPCGKCGQKKVAYTQAQTRSADEPMTTFCECQNCGHRWKFC